MEINIKTPEDVRILMKMHVIPAAITTALELHLFWYINDQSVGLEDISQKFRIPQDRCHYWLELLVELGLLKQENLRYKLTSLSQSIIIETYSPESWAFIAQAAREQYLTGYNLTSHISHPKSVMTAQGEKSLDWFKRIQEDPEYARRFTYTLYEIHYSSGEKLAQSLNMKGVKRLMDLGGGSGVMSLALLKQHPELTAVVIDIPNVCVIGREIAAKSSVADRIVYQAADFDHDDLPTGFDMILNCDAGGFNQELLYKLFKALNEGGQLIIVSNIEMDSDWLETHPREDLSFPLLLRFFQNSLTASKLSHMTITEGKKRLTETGFHSVVEETLEDGILIVRAQKP
ncbi:MAG: methyltransferase [Candidatus Heimdallarchaeota archaeon]|nr:MAG: methyltransferase [Candidatus Heimdallarchaeota archaeon]